MLHIANYIGEKRPFRTSDQHCERVFNTHSIFIPRALSNLWKSNRRELFATWQLTSEPSLRSVCGWVPRASPNSILLAIGCVIFLPLAIDSRKAGVGEGGVCRFPRQLCSSRLPKDLHILFSVWGPMSFRSWTIKSSLGPYFYGKKEVVKRGNHYCVTKPLKESHKLLIYLCACFQMEKRNIFFKSTLHTKDTDI